MIDRVNKVFHIATAAGILALSAISCTSGKTGISPSYDTVPAGASHPITDDYSVDDGIYTGSFFL